MINNKIEKINQLLNDEKSLDEYINQVYNSDCDIPLNLESRIISKIEKKDGKNNKKAHRSIDILKIAACIVISILIWNVSLSSNANTSYATSKSIKRSEFYTRLDKVMEDINSFFMTPIKFERREK